jgi:hypothetical protein
MTIPAPTIDATAPRPLGRRVLFGALDLLFLVAISTISVAAMHLAHMIGWPFLVEMLIGMAGAMALQIVLAVLVAPILGSIESAVPSMVVAMATPMVLCGLHVIGCRPEWGACLAVGAGLGAGSFLLLVAYGASCRRHCARLGKGAT